MRTTGEKILDLIYPPSLYCICCGNIIDETRHYNLCDHCISHIQWNGDDSRNIDGMRTDWCVYYGPYERTLIFSLKYNGKKYIARDIAAIMADKLEYMEKEFDCIVPVPISAERKKERGFNQMELVGKHLSEITGKPCFGDCLFRTRKTMPMRGPGPEERKANIRGAIALNGKYDTILRNRTVLLIDDFYTTGSTASECREILEKAGPHEVAFLAFAAQ